jgi:hypothetical protein
MSKAMELLEEAIEVARQEGYSEGYAAAMQAVAAAIQDLAAKTSSLPNVRFTGAASLIATVTPRRKAPSGEGDYVPVERGANAILVESALQSVFPRAIGPTEVQHIVARDAGKKLAYSSTRHALDQLRARGMAQEDSARRWQYVPQDERTESPGAEPSNSIPRPTSGGDPGGGAPGSIDSLQSMAAE